MLIKDENGGGEPIHTTIQKGDACTWIIPDGTVAFNRGGTKLRRFDGDDKFLFQFTTHLQFGEFVQAIADATGYETALSQENDRCVTYRFF